MGIGPPGADKPAAMRGPPAVACSVRYLVGRGVPFWVCALVAHHAGAAAVADLIGLADVLAAFDDEQARCGTRCGTAT